jgi:YHS domain-containing protein
MKSSLPFITLLLTLPLGCAEGTKNDAPAATAANATTASAPTAVAAPAKEAAKSPAKSPAGLLVDDAGIAAQGYDVVAYVKAGAAKKGDAAHTTKHGGATYVFSSAENKAAFEAAPDEFLPAFGGYCAFAVAKKNAKVPPNPETFRVQDGRLLLFFNGDHEGKNVDTSKMWDGAPGEMLKAADGNWPSVKGS